ncbi:MAG: GntR family transcriptional regulator [Magnetovibrio sp.]|nr:GntR family transcriptional regulator [Magnetovibrio sp.]
MTANTAFQKEASRLSERVYELLLERIISGQLPAGTVLAEKRLAEELGVSRTPMHEAIRDLIKDGFVHQIKNHRPTVSRFTAQDVFEIFEMRALLEGEAAYLAAQRIDRTTLKDLRETGMHFENISYSCSRIKAWADYEDDFHNCIAKASGNKRLYQGVVRVRLSHRALNVHIMGSDSIQDALHQHFEILDALDCRDGARARTAMRNHIKEWQTYFITLLESP